MGAIKDDDGDPSANPSLTQPYQRQHRLSTTARSSHSYGSYETGEASTAVSLNESLTGTTAPAHSPRIDIDDPNLSSHAPDQGTRDLNHEVYKRRRSHKPRSSGGFLLAHTILDEPSKTTSASRDDGRRRSRIPVDSRRGKSPLNKPEKSNTTGLGIDVQELRRSSDSQGNRVASPAPDEERQHGQGRQAMSKIPTLRPTTAPLDVDSSQIVSMALNLSESRRMAERRNMSSPIPPRLAQLPDTLAGGSLKQHLQQQRRTSRTISPKPDRVLTPRAMSTSRIASPLQSSFDHEASYTYHFSSSTLNRAQKAKEYLELMAQYRRLLQFLPPLKQDARSRPSSSNISTSPTSGKSPDPPNSPTQVQLGRAYNPLQYVRNRKVRARERKAIDGEALGFADVSRVTGWVDDTAALAAKSALSLGSSPLPRFPGAHENDEQGISASNIPRPIATVGKPKRVRIDWSIDPADMIADAYWLEQGDHKYLIEDRHYAKIFPQRPDTQGSISHTTNEPVTSALSTSSTKDGDIADVPAASETDLISPTRTESDVPPVSARDRARQKIHDFRGQHKQNGLSHSHHDFLRLGKGLSDTSDSESDRKRRNRTGTIGASGRDLLEKQMLEMLAKEATEEQNERKISGEPGRGHLKPLPSGFITPDNVSQTPEQLYSRRGSRVEIVDNLEKTGRGRVAQGSPIGSGRPSLDVPGQSHRFSTDLDSSRPESPDMRPSRGRNTLLPTIGMDLSPPSSRPGSPGRGPFSRVKSIFRDRSKEREYDSGNVAREKDEKVDSPIEPPESLNLSVPAETSQSPDRRRSKSLTRKIISRPTHESHKSHRSMGSIKFKPDDQVGLRSLFKGGAKIDGMIRGSVSKVTDLLWKKDDDGESSSTSSSEDSDEESKRGRVREPATSRSNSRRPRDSTRQKDYLGIMPSFNPASISQDKPVSEEDDTLPRTNTTYRPRSPRFDQLKPPRIDIRKASPPTSYLEHTKSRLLRDSDVSDTESRSHESTSYGDKSRSISRDLSDVPPLPAPQALQNRPRIGSRTLSQGARKWSISNHSPSSRGGKISRREVARVRALILCSGIKAMEISRRAHEPHPLFAPDNNQAVIGLSWTDVSQFAPDELVSLSATETQLYPATARVLVDSIDHSLQVSEASTAKFTAETATSLKHRVETLHGRVGGELAALTHSATDEADELGRDLVGNQLLKTKRVADTMDTMMRRRRRRFRWARRAGWLAVEWALVGFMWYVWFIVMLARVVLGVGRGIVGVGRWLLWL